MKLRLRNLAREDILSGWIAFSFGGPGSPPRCNRGALMAKPGWSFPAPATRPDARGGGQVAVVFSPRLLQIVDVGSGRFRE